MAEKTRTRIMSALLKSLYHQGFISEDIYHHSLNNLPAAEDHYGRPACDAAKTQRDAESDGRR